MSDGSIDELVELMDMPSLRALVRRQASQIDRLLSERESHVRGVELSFTRRHNEQRDEIDQLEKLVRTLKHELSQRRKAS